MVETAPGDFEGTDRFEVRRRIGAGGMGAVYEVYDREREQAVALKTILRRNPSSLYRFKKEFRSLANLSHPNLVRLHELISEGDRWFFTMELVDGVDFLRFVCPEGPLPADDPLGDSATHSRSFFEGMPTSGLAPGDEGSGSGEVIAAGQVGDEAPPATEVEPTRTWTGTNPLSIAPAGRARTARPPNLLRLRAALRQLAEALEALHARGILHRDIKPSNVLVTRRGRLLLLDFGLSTALEKAEGGETTTGMVVGTASYMAPEQAAGLPLTTAGDWYSVGTMLYRALTGRLPFEGPRLEVMLAKQTNDPPRPSEVAPSVPADLDTLCMDLLARAPSARPSGLEVLQRLGGPDEGEVRPTTRPGPVERPFVGRETHLAAMGDAFRSVLRGRPTALLLRGPSGAGKSTLLNRFLEDVAGRGEAIVLSGRCYEQESVAFKALDTLVDALSRFLRQLRPLEAAALLPRDTPVLARVFPVLRRVRAVAEAPGRGAQVADAQELRCRAFAALRELLGRIADRKPLILAIDDLQWGDLDSALLIRELLKPPDPPPLLLIAAFRREYESASPCLRELLRPGGIGLPDEDRRTLAVEALRRDECLALSRGFFGADDPHLELKAEAIARESRGIPFFAIELALDLAKGGDLSGEEASERLSLDAVLWRRIARLPPPARAVLEAVAVAGQPVRQAIACRASGLGADGYEALAQLRSEHLVRGTGPGALDDVEAYHDRVRETVVAHLPPDRLRALHRALAEELEIGRRADPETLAAHFDAGGVPAQAGHYYADAASAAAHALAFDRAASLYARALELMTPEAAEARRISARLGDALANAGRGFDAAQAYLEAAATAPPTEALTFRRFAGFQYLISGHIEEGLSAYRDVLERAGMPLPRTPARARARLNWTRLRLALRGLRFTPRDPAAIDPLMLERVDLARSVALGMSMVDVIRGAEFQAKSLLVALQAGDPARIALALGWEAVHSACDGTPVARRTARLVALGRQIADSTGDPRAIGMVAMATGCTAYLVARHPEALGSIERAEEVFRGCTGVAWEHDTARIFHLWILMNLGRYAELRRLYFRYDTEARDRGNRYLRSSLNPYSGTHALLAAGEVDLARARMDDALSGWPAGYYHLQHMYHLYGSIAVALYSGDGEAAWRRLLFDLPRLREALLTRVQDIRIDVWKYTGQAALAAAAGRSDRAELLGAAERSARRIGREPTVRSAPLAALILAGAAHLRGDSIGSVARLREAVAGFDATGFAMLAAAARARLGRIVGGDEGRELLDASRRFMAEQEIREPDRVVAMVAPGFDPP